MKKSMLCAVALFGMMCVLAASTASADILYDNTTSRSYDMGTPTIDYPIIYGVADSFTLSQPATLTGFTVGLWVGESDPLTTLSWSIETSAPGGAVLASGTEAPTSVVEEKFFFQYFVNQYTFANTMNLSLDSGTYWLALDSFTTSTESFNPEWDGSAGSSTGYDPDAGTIPSETFQILGGSQTSDTPEPSSYLLLGTGLVGIVLLVVKRKAVV